MNSLDAARRILELDKEATRLVKITESNEAEFYEIRTLAPRVAKRYLGAVKLLEMLKKHYSHPIHDHNWAYYVNETIEKFLSEEESK